MAAVPPAPARRGIRCRVPRAKPGGLAQGGDDGTDALRAQPAVSAGIPAAGALAHVPPAVNAGEQRARRDAAAGEERRPGQYLSLIHISEPTRLGMISYAVFCLKKKKK